MSDTETPKKLNRREIAGITAAATAMAALGATPAQGAQGRMLAALAHCEAALEELKRANSNKGGHRKTAMEHLRYVISQIKEGIDHAKG